MVNQTADLPRARADMLSGLLKIEEIQKVLILIIVTRLQWRSMNYHPDSPTQTTGFVNVLLLLLLLCCHCWTGSRHLPYTP